MCELSYWSTYCQKPCQILTYWPITASKKDDTHTHMQLYVYRRLCHKQCFSSDLQLSSHKQWRVKKKTRLVYFKLICSSVFCRIYEGFILWCYSSTGYLMSPFSGTFRTTCVIVHCNYSTWTFLLRFNRYEKYSWSQKLWDKSVRCCLYRCIAWRLCDNWDALFNSSLTRSWTKETWQLDSYHCSKHGLLIINPLSTFWLGAIH